MNQEHFDALVTLERDIGTALLASNRMLKYDRIRGKLRYGIRISLTDQKYNIHITWGRYGGFDDTVFDIAVTPLINIYQTRVPPIKGFSMNALIINNEVALTLSAKLGTPMCESLKEFVAHLILL